MSHFDEIIANGEEPKKALIPSIHATDSLFKRESVKWGIIRTNTFIFFRQNIIAETFVKDVF